MKAKADGFPRRPFFCRENNLRHSTYTPYFRQWRMPKTDITM